MVKLYFIRHGEAQHNVAAKLHGDAAYDMPEFWNSSLTDNGIKQAHTLQTIMDLHDKYIIVSPLQRALETAHEGFPGSTFIIDDRVSEFNPAWPCNRRIDYATLEDEWQGHILKCSRTTPKQEETSETFKARVTEFLESMRGGEDAVIVTHHDYIRAVFDIQSIEQDKINHCHPYIVEF